MSEKTLGEKIIAGLEECVHAEKFISKEVIKFVLQDPTRGATSEYAQGYRDALEQVKRDLKLND